jgi:hypothetical protein
MKLPTFGNEYDGQKQRELIRLLELTLRQLRDAMSAAGVGTTGGSSGSTGGSTGGPTVTLSNTTPRPLEATGRPGTSAQASRSDHVHRLPTLQELGAEAVGAALAIIQAHELAKDPHPQYLTADDGIFPTELIPGAEKVTMDSIIITVDDPTYTMDSVGSQAETLVPEHKILLIGDQGLDVQGTLNLKGSLMSVASDGAIRFFAGPDFPQASGKALFIRTGQYADPEIVELWGKL